MIESLTKAQQAKFPKYVKKWTDIGLCTKRANRPKAEKTCREAYKVAGLEEPKLILWAKSPMGLLLTAKLIKEISKQGKKPYSEMDLKSVRASVGASVRASVWDSVWDSVRASVGASVRASVWDSVRASVGASVRASVWDSVRASVLKEEYYQTGSYGQHDVGWLSFHDFFLNECNIKDCEKLQPLMNLSQETGWHLFYKDIAILSEKPTELYRNGQGRLHNPKGPAIKYADGYELYSLNGISVTKEIATLKPTKITKDLILKETNADIRREIVRKLSPLELVKKLKGKVLDKEDGYELLGIDIGDGNVRPFLKMRNPSIKAVHIEGVLPGTTTVRDAIKYRNNLTDYQKPVKLS